MTNDETHTLRMSCIGSGRLSAPAMQRAMEHAKTQMPQTHLHGGGLTLGQIHEIRLDRLTGRVAGLFGLRR